MKTTLGKSFEKELKKLKDEISIPDHSCPIIDSIKRKIRLLKVFDKKPVYDDILDQLEEVRQINRMLRLCSFRYYKLAKRF